MIKLNVNLVNLLASSTKTSFTSVPTSMVPGKSGTIFENGKSSITFWGATFWDATVS